MRKKAPQYYEQTLEFLRELYPDPHSELNYTNPFELIVAVSLSAQCTDKKVNETTPALFKTFPDCFALSKAKVEKVEALIREVNYYKTKSKHIIQMSKDLIEHFDGKVPTRYEDLVSLPGVGRKTANVVLSELKITPAIPVDTHVFRVSKRLGIAEGKNPDEVERSLQKNFESKDWYNLHHWLIFHGRRVCKAQRPMCGECALREICPSSVE